MYIYWATMMLLSFDKCDWIWENVHQNKMLKKLESKKILVFKKITYVHRCIHTSFTRLLTRFQCADIFTAPAKALKARPCKRA